MQTDQPADQTVVLVVRVPAQTVKADIAKLQDAIENVVIESGIVSSVEWSSFREFR